jgi:hypothetical protein
MCANRDSPSGKHGIMTTLPDAGFGTEPSGLVRAGSAAAGGESAESPAG